MIEPIYVALGERVASRRLRLGLTQQDIADKMGLSRSVIANFETGRSRMLLHDAVMLATVLGRRVSWLVGDTNAKRGLLD